MNGDIFINDVQVPDRRLKLGEGSIEFKKERRSINNTLTSDIIAIKKMFTFTWDSLLDGNYVRDIITLYETGTDVTLKLIGHDGVEITYTCALKIDGTKIRELKKNNFAYSGFTFILEEV